MNLIGMIKKLICVFVLVLQSCGDPKPVKPAPVVQSAFGLTFSGQAEFESRIPPFVHQKLRQALMEQKKDGVRKDEIELLLDYTNYGEGYAQSIYEDGGVFLDEKKTLELVAANNYTEFYLLLDDGTNRWEGDFYACSPELREALMRDDSLKLVPRKREPSER
jgi:hypothetical protein